MLTHEERERLAEENPEALLLDGFDKAYVGLAKRPGAPALAVYDRARCIELLVVESGMSEEVAEEYFEHNVACAYVGEHTPIILVRPE